jgi:hypothetical protein
VPEPATSLLTSADAMPEPARRQRLDARLTFTMRELAGLMGLSLCTVRRYCERGFFETVKLGQYRLVVAASVYRLLDEASAKARDRAG